MTASSFAISHIAASVFALPDTVSTGVRSLENVKRAVRAGLGIIALEVKPSFSTNIARARKARRAWSGGARFDVPRTLGVVKFATGEGLIEVYAR